MRTEVHQEPHGDTGPAVTGPDPHGAAEPDDANVFVCWIGDVSSADARVVGCTGATLGELARAGRPVPPGFVVTVGAYLRALDQFGGRAALHARIADVDLHDPRSLTRAARSCQALVRSADMPAAVRRSVLDAYTRLACEAGHAVPVVVQASPTPDDPASTSCTGMDLTFSDVCSGLELVDRIIDCWAARWSPLVVADRAARAIKREPAIAVVVARQ